MTKSPILLLVYKAEPWPLGILSPVCIREAGPLFLSHLLASKFITLGFQTWTLNVLPMHGQARMTTIKVWYGAGSAHRLANPGQGIPSLYPNGRSGQSSVWPDPHPSILTRCLVCTSRLATWATSVPSTSRSLGTIFKSWLSDFGLLPKTKNTAWKWTVSTEVVSKLCTITHKYKCINYNIIA